jgi:hypothetical protein
MARTTTPRFSLAQKLAIINEAERENNLSLVFNFTHNTRLPEDMESQQKLFEIGGLKRIGLRL